MGLSGTWVSQRRQSRDFAGSLKQGTGYHPIHEVRDTGSGRVTGTVDGFYPPGPDVSVSPMITDPDVDWVVDDYGIPGADEDYRYQDEFPSWDVSTPEIRDSTHNRYSGEWAPWGVVNDPNPIDGFPLPGPTAGMSNNLDVDHGEITEQRRAINVPTMPVTGGWLSKQRGQVAQAEAQDPSQPGYTGTINTAAVQGPGKKTLDNARATGRGTDALRSAITSREAGQSVKSYAQSFAMGGGPGTPDMGQQGMTVGLRRPFLVRTAATPPDEAHAYNTMEGRYPIQRDVPPDPYQGGAEYGGGPGLFDAPDEDWGY